MAGKIGQFFRERKEDALDYVGGGGVFVACQGAKCFQ